MAEMHYDTDGGTVLLILAHPDDELMLRPLMEREAASGARLVCAYTTNAPGQGGGRRERELRAATRGLVAADDLHFPGVDVGAQDGRSVERIGALIERLRMIADGLPELTRVLSHACEGGHPDHEVAHVLAAKLADERGVAARSYAVSHYRTSETGWPPFAVQAEHPGGSSRLRIEAGEAWRMLSGARHFPSQWRSLGPLLPMMMWSVLRDRSLHLAPLRLPTPYRLPRPEKRATMTESRFKVDIDAFERAANDFLQAP